jgi:hypothetical protein
MTTPKSGKGGRPCSICRHPNLIEMQAMLVQGIPLSHIASRFHPVTSQSLSRQQRTHVTVAMMDAAQLVLSP